MVFTNTLRTVVYSGPHTCAAEGMGSIPVAEDSK